MISAGSVVWTSSIKLTLCSWRRSSNSATVFPAPSSALFNLSSAFASHASNSFLICSYCLHKSHMRLILASQSFDCCCTLCQCSFRDWIWWRKMFLWDSFPVSSSSLKLISEISLSRYCFPRSSSSTDWKKKRHNFVKDRKFRVPDNTVQ